MKKFFCTLMMAFVVLLSASSACYAQDSGSNRKERNYITEGNKLYNDGRYRAALNKYQEALRENPSSAVARYNLGLAQIRLGSNPSDTTATAKQFLANGVKAMEEIAALGKEKPNLAARANYNLGNVAFNSEDYSKALGLYKQALRFNPADDSARRNLRITQLKLQNQNNDKNQDKNQDQNKDQQNQDQNKDQNKDQNQDQNKDQNQNQDKNQQQNQQQDINQQTADQILKA
ncbi:MAG: tetratricopeptide repeat protein, partial [Muribaculaceae bacterium]|nr:tetratricopeptide repeat protein [Muribaculaceae bacterium]